MWQQEQWGKCPTCGTFEWEWEDNPEAWTAGLHWCLGCRDVELLNQQVERDKPLHPEGYKIRLYKEKDDDGQ